MIGILLILSISLYPISRADDYLLFSTEKGNNNWKNSRNRQLKKNKKNSRILRKKDRRKSKKSYKNKRKRNKMSRNI